MKHYHVFTDGMDEYTSTIKEAREIVKLWREDWVKDYETTRMPWRIYTVIEDENGDAMEEEYHSGGYEWPQ